MADQELPSTAICPDCAACHGPDLGQLDPETGMYVCIRGHRFYPY
ncbi:hypothetical protein [Streptosporangium canum]